MPSSYSPATTSQNIGRTFPKYRPVLKLAASRFGNNRWIVFSYRLMRLVYLYSNLEYDHWVLVESNHLIVDYCEQPLRIRMRLASGIVTAVFDMWLEFFDGAEEFREVKFRDQLADPRVKRQIEAEEFWCQRSRATFRLFDEVEIRANALYLANWKAILPCLAATRTLDLTGLSANILQLLDNNGATTLTKINKWFPQVEALLVNAAIFRLIHSGKLTAPLAIEPFNSELLIETRRLA